MNAIEVDSVITQIARSLFRQPDLELSDEMTAQDVRGWDSLNHVNFIIQIEEELGIRFKNDEIAKLTNVGELKKLTRMKVDDLSE